MKIAPMYTVKQVSLEIGFSERIIRTAIEDKKLEAISIAREYRLTEAAVQAWLNSRTLKAINQRKPVT